MIPIGRTGIVRKGSLKGWWIRVQVQEKPQGFLVTRARAPEMQDTIVVDGLFPDEASIENFFSTQAPRVDWQE